MLTDLIQVNLRRETANIGSDAAESTAPMVLSSQQYLCSIDDLGIMGKQEDIIASSTVV